MIDLIFWAQTKAQFETFAKGKGYMITDEEGVTLTIRYVNLAWWAGSGKLMKVKGTYDADGVELTPPQFEPGFFVYLRMSGPVHDADHLEATEETPKSWHKSRLAADTYGNGEQGTAILDGQVSAYQSGAVRIVDADELQAYIAANNLPGYEWLGGNVG